MDNLWMLYWVTRLDSINNLFTGLLTVGFGIGFMNLIVGTMLYSEDGMPKWLYVSIWCLSVFMIVFGAIGKTLVPTKEDAYVIAAGVAVTEVAQSESAKRIASKSVSVIEAWLQKQEVELKKENK